MSEDGIRPLEILTGGSPRLLVIVAEFAQHRSLSQLMEELVTLIDDHTEYFRSHLEVLASVERRVYLAVIDLWQPSNAGEIAARARKDIRSVSTLLRRLVNRGAVIVEGTGRKRLYVAAERLYSIYYKLRRERDEAAVVANLIHFMAVFYSKAELAEMSDKLIAEVAGSKVIREGFERAIARLGDSDIPDHQVPVNWTLFKKGMRQIQMGHAKEALLTCEEIERKLDALTGNEKIEFTWRVRCVQTFALLVQKKRRAAVDAFRSAYAVFVPDNEKVMNEMLHFVPELIAQGVSERDLIESLSSDKEKLDALVPLMVALLQRAGEVVRAPMEVLEVAKDINKDIDAKMSN